MIRSPLIIVEWLLKAIKGAHHQMDLLTAAAEVIIEVRIKLW
jgi:hypothetical protein